MGHGDTSSIPADLKNAKQFCSFLCGLLPIIHSAAKQLVDLARNVATNPTTKNARESAVKIVQQLIESQLQKDKVKGSEFKSNQVQNPWMLAYFSLLCYCALTSPIICSCSTLQWTLLACYYAVCV
jgi:hypothetical protein